MILDAMKYEAGLIRNYLGWFSHFNKNTDYFFSSSPIKNLKRYEVNSGGSIFLQQVLEDVVELKSPRITKYLAADLNCLSSVADDLIDHDGEDLKKFEYIIKDPQTLVPGEWEIVRFLAEHVQRIMGEKYDEMKVILPGCMNSLKMEINAKTKEEAKNATEIVGQEYGEFGIKLAEIYCGREVDDNLRRAAQIPFIIGNFVDDIGDLYDDLGKKNTYVTLLYEELKDEVPKNELKIILQEDVDRICRDLDNEGLSLARNKDAYRLLSNAIKMKFNVKRKRTMRKI